MAISDAGEHGGGRQASQAVSALGVSRRGSSYAKSLWGFAVVIHLFAMPAFADSVDVLAKQFLEPPAHYGVVPFYWGTGKPLSVERITWQLDQLKANGDFVDDREKL